MKHITYIFSVTAATLIACILSTMGLSAKNRTGLSPAASVECLIERICPGASKHFFIQIDTSATESYFELAQGSDNRIIISADCPINAATGLNWYLKYYAGIHLSWNCMRAELPAELPPVPVPERRTTRSQYRYYLNYCTFSYSPRHQPMSGGGRLRRTVAQRPAPPRILRYRCRGLHSRTRIPGLVADEQSRRLGRSQSILMVRPQY